MTTLKLGNYDRGTAPENWRNYLINYHELPRMQTDVFRGDANDLWHAPQALAGTPIAELQLGLKELGYLPTADVDGIFGYRTLSAVWLFQEYMRTVGGKPELGAPDGLVGKNTRVALESALAANLRCRWTVAGQRQDQPWLVLLESAKRKYEHDYRRILPTLFQRPSDILTPLEWQTGQVPVHIIGIRRTAWAASLDRSGKRLNNDVFIVIANGRVMRFFWIDRP